jgi:hypothetical protein
MQLGSAGRCHQDVVETPVDVDGHEISRVYHGDNSDGRSDGGETPARITRCRGIRACVDDRDLGSFMGFHSVAPERRIPDLLREQLKRRQNRGKIAGIGK